MFSGRSHPLFSESTRLMRLLLHLLHNTFRPRTKPQRDYRTAHPASAGSGRRRRKRDCNHGSEYRRLRQTNRRNISRPYPVARPSRGYRALSHLLDRAQFAHRRDHRIRRRFKTLRTSLSHSAAIGERHGIETHAAPLRHRPLCPQDSDDSPNATRRLHRSRPHHRGTRRDRRTV